MSSNQQVLAAVGGVPTNSFLVGYSSSASLLNVAFSVTDSVGNTYTAGNYGVAKFSPLQELVWIRSFATANRPFGITLDPDGDVYICGRNVASSPERAIIAKYSNSGVFQWANGLYTSYDLYFSSVCADTNGVYVCGAYQDNTTPEYFGIVAKYNTSGVLQWQKQNVAAGPTRFNAACLASDGSLYVCGANFAYAAAGTYVVKYNSSGTEQWGRTVYDGSGALSSNGFGITTNSSGDVYVLAGENNNTNLFVKFNSSGTVQWQHITGTTTFASLGAPSLQGVSVVPDGNVCFQLNFIAANYSTGFILMSESTGAVSLSRRLRKTDNSHALTGSSLSLSGGANIVASGTSSGTYLAFTLRMKLDGATLGTFGDYTYENPSTTASSSSRTVATTSSSSTTSSYLEFTPTFSDAAGTWTSALYLNL